ncbi:hypothetical protein L6R52_38570, partial [Myxococcota bacterium]|nr:hypothetical protein [Myxococcota bacterium]
AEVLAEARDAEDAALEAARDLEAARAAAAARVVEAERTSEAERLAEAARALEGVDTGSLAVRVGVSAIETRADDTPTDFEGASFGPESETVPSADLLVPRGPGVSASPGDHTPLAPLGSEGASVVAAPLAGLLGSRFEGGRSELPRRGPPPPPPPDHDDHDDESDALFEGPLIAAGLAIRPTFVAPSVSTPDEDEDAALGGREADVSTGDVIEAAEPARDTAEPEDPPEDPPAVEPDDGVAAWRGRVDAWTASLERLEEAERVEVRRQIARALVDHLGDPMGAEDVLRAGLAERAREPLLLEQLEERYEARAAYAELVDVLERRLDVAPDGPARSALHRKIAAIAERHLAKPERALDALNAAIAEDPADLDVLGELERLRRAREDWEGVAAALVLRSRARTSEVDRATTLVELASIRAELLADPQGATDSLQEALALVPGHRGALEVLASMEERRGDYVEAIETLRHLLREVDGTAKAKVHVQIGRIYERRLDDAKAATIEHQAAYDADPSCLDAILALSRTRELEGRFTEAVDLAARAATLTEDERERAYERVGDERRAIELYGKALALDPEDLATAAALGALLFERQELERAYPLLRRAADGLSDPERAASLFELAGRAAQKLQRRTDAITCFEAALVRAPRSQGALMRLSELLEHSESWPRVYELCAALVLHHESALATPDRAAVYLRMARAKRASKELEAAVRLARKAHLLAEAQAEPLALLADVLAENGDAFDAAEALKKLSQLLRAPHEKRNALHRAALLLADEADDVARAAAMLGEAQTFVADDVEVAELLSRYRERLGDAKGAADALIVPARLLGGRVRADLLVRAARILAGPGRDRAGAKKLWAEALDVVPTHADALAELRLAYEVDRELERLVRLLDGAARAFLDDPTSARDARELDRKAAARALWDDALRVQRLGLRDLDGALAVLRRLLELAPDDKVYREEHARLLDRVAEKAASPEPLVREAIGAWARLVEEEPGYVEGLRRLKVLRAKAGEHALARLAEDLLVALGQEAANGATPEDPFPAPRPQTLKLKGVDVAPHPQEESALASIFAELGYAPIRAFFDVLPEPKPKKKDLVGPAGLGIHVARPLDQAALVLGLDVPPVYVRDDAPEAIVPALVADEPALVVSLALASKASAPELRFLIGRALSLLRPRALALATIPLDVLRDGLAGLAKPAIAPESVFADAKRSKKLGKALEKALPSHERVPLAEAVGRWLAAPERRSLGAERAAVLRTAERAGLVASGSLSASIGALRALSDGQLDRTWHLPLIEFAATRTFADIVRGLGQ